MCVGVQRLNESLILPLSMERSTSSCFFLVRLPILYSAAPPDRIQLSKEGSRTRSSGITRIGTRSNSPIRAFRFAPKYYHQHPTLVSAFRMTYLEQTVCSLVFASMVFFSWSSISLRERSMKLWPTVGGSQDVAFLQISAWNCDP